MVGETSMSYMQAAFAVLKASEHPMSTQELVDVAMRHGLLRPRGKTPVATMSAYLYRYIRDHPSAELIRVAPQGSRPEPKRAPRGSVRWALRSRDGEAASVH